MHNIERLPGKPYYTGYGANGVLYHIHKREGGGWRGCPISGGNIPWSFPKFIYAKTLKEVSKHLETKEN